MFETPFIMILMILQDFFGTKGNVIECAAVKSLNFCKEYIKSEKVFRDNRKELVELVVAYLSSAGVQTFLVSRFCNCTSFFSG